MACPHCQLITNARKSDPSQTGKIIRAFDTEIRRRFTEFRRALDSYISKTGLLLPIVVRKNPITGNAVDDGGIPYQFPTSEQKMLDFLVWLSEQSDAGILSVYVAAPRMFGGIPHWSGLFIASAYQQGMARAWKELQAAGYETPVPVDSLDAYLTSSFYGPVHAERVGQIYARTYTELKGVTDAMAAKMSSILATGMAQGQNPKVIAAELHKAVKIGEQRAMLIARTEVIRAHHMANIAEYRAAGVEGVVVLVEWVSALDDRVCPDCLDLHGRLFTIDEIEPLIPLHPNCRCVGVPAGIGEKPTPASEWQNAKVGPMYRRKDGSVKYRGFYKKITGKNPPPRAT